MCKFFVEELDTSYFCVMFQNMLSNSIHKTASGYYSVKNMCIFYGKENFGWDGGMVLVPFIPMTLMITFCNDKPAKNQYKLEESELQLNKIKNKLFYLLSSKRSTAF